MVTPLPKLPAAWYQAGVKVITMLSERQVHRVLREYVETYFNSARPHQGLSQRIPALAASWPVSEVGRNVVARPILGGLHHDYQWAA